jgi:hypothetical protein
MMTPHTLQIAIVPCEIVDGRPVMADLLAMLPDNTEGFTFRTSLHTVVVGGEHLMNRGCDQLMVRPVGSMLHIVMTTLVTDHLDRSKKRLMIAVGSVDRNTNLNDMLDMMSNAARKHNGGTVNQLTLIVFRTKIEEHLCAIYPSFAFNASGVEALVAGAVSLRLMREFIV